MPIAMGLLVMVQSLGQFLGALVAPMVLAGGWMALGLFVMVLGLVGTGASGARAHEGGVRGVELGEWFSFIPKC